MDRLLLERANRTPDAVAFRFVDREDEEGLVWTYADLHARAGAIARSLREGGVAPGDPVVLLYPQGLDYIGAFFGCLYADAIPVPLLPARSKRGWARIRTVLGTSGARSVLTTANLESSVRDALHDISAHGDLRYFVTDRLANEADFVPETKSQNAIAFLQYTSGSTASPRGVVVGHDNLLANLWTIHRAFRIRSDSHVLSWLPLYHDMGLIGGVLEPLFAGVPGTLLSPIAFVQKPLLWLRAIGRFRATISGAPNFAYRMCVERATGEEIAQLDLSTWELAFCGSERIGAKVMEDFAETFAWAGFQRETMLPCYGLAEATLFVSGGPQGHGARLTSISRTGMAMHRALPPKLAADATRLVSCGVIPEEHDVRIVNPENGIDVEESGIGEILIAGPSVARGYWGEPPEPPGRHLRTGDLGFVRGGELYVTGRCKEILIVRGANLYPQDLEFAAEASHAALVTGGSAAFAVLVEDSEEIVLVMEVAKGDGGHEYPAVVAAVRAAVAETFQQSVHSVVLVRRNTVPRTTSGKIQRGLCKVQFEAGDLHAMYREGPAPEARETGTADAVADVPAQGLDAGRALLVERIARMAGVPASQVDLSRTAADYGFSSLSAASMAHDLERVLGRAVGMDRFFAGRALDAMLADVMAHGRAVAAVRATPAGASRVALTRGQLAIWAAEKLVPGTHGYLIARAVTMPDDLDEDAWARSLTAVARKHPLLRTRIVEGVEGIEPEEGCFLELLPLATLEMARADLCDVPDGPELRRRLSELAMRPLDLSAGPMLRAILARCSNGRRVLLVTVHHIVSDFVSMVRLLEDWCAAYGSPSLPSNGDGEELQLEASVQLDESEAWSEAKDHWKAALEGELPMLELPHDRPRPKAPRHQGLLSHARAVGAPSKLDALAKECGTTRFVVALTAYAAFLQRWTGQNEFVIGTPVTQRRSPDDARRVGFFPNFIPLRVAVPDAVTLRQLVPAVRDVVNAALRHASLPFPEIVKAAGVARSPGVHPLFQASFTLHETPAGIDPNATASALHVDGVPVRMGGMTLTTYGLDDDGCHHDFMVFSGVVGNDLVVHTQSDAALFDAASARTMTEGCAELLTALLRQPDVLLDDVAFGTPSIVYGKKLAATAPSTIVARIASHDVHAIAVADRHRSLRYGELVEHARAIAETLRARGVQPGDPVGLCAEERSAAGVVAMVGILMAGAWFVPLSSQLPIERLRFIQEDLGARFVMARADHARPYEAAGFDVLDVSPAHAEGSVGPTAPGTAYAIYTSGSTGTPKAVVVEHAQVVHFADAVAARYGIGPGDSMVSGASWSFDAMIFEIPVFLVLGARVYVADEEERRSPPKKLALLREHRATVHNDTPVAFREVIEAMLEEAGCGEPLPEVKTWVVGGEATTPKDVERLRAVYASAGREPAAFINSYGPTESTVFVTEHACRAGDVASVRVPIGLPLPGMTALVLDEQKRPVPWGARGQLYVSGPAVARGYWRQPELTERAFFESLDPQAPPGTRMYRTGDLVRLRPNGWIDFLGRADRQVKLRGHRIELAEIEHAFAEQEGVAQALVTTRVVAGSPALVAYVVPKAGAQISGRELRARLHARLPAFMVPWIVAVIDAFPIGPTGKVAEQKLPAAESFVEKADVRAARSPIEEAIVVAVGDVLGASVGPDDHFFELGGDSIAALRVVTRLRSGGLSLEIRQLLEHPRLSELAVVIAGAKPVRDTGPSYAEVVRHARTAGPIHAWFARQTTGDWARFVQWVRIPLPPGDPAALAESVLRGLVRKHRAFAQGFAREEGTVTRVDLPEERRWRLVHADAGASTQGLIDAEIAAGTAFVPDRGPLLAGLLVEGDLVLAAHHFAVDVFSWHLILADVEALLQGKDAGIDDFDFARFAAAISRVAEKGRASQSVAQWNALLCRFEPAKAYAALETSDARTWELSEETTAALLGNADRVLRARPQDILLAALGRAVCAELQLESAPIHVEVHGRDEDVLGIPTGVGWCATWVPYVVPFAENVVESIAAVKDARAELAHGGLDFLPLLVGGDLAPEAVAAFLQPGVQFNYLGTVLDRGQHRGFGLHRGESGARLEATAMVREKRMVLSIAGHGGIGERWCREIDVMVQTLSAAARRIYTRSDFPGVGISDESARQLSDRVEGAIEEIVPLNALQRLMLLRHLSNPTEGRTNGHVHLRVQGALALEELEQRLRAMVAGHPALRSVFDWTALDEPVQIVFEAMPASVSFADARSAGLDVLVQRAVSSPIDLTVGPIVRLHVVRTGEAEHHVLLTTDHVAIDGWSLAAVTAGLFSPRSTPSYALRTLRASQKDETHAYWVAKLRGLPAPSATVPQARGAITVQKKLTSGVADALRTRAKNLGVALSSVLVGTWSRVMAGWSGAGDTLVGLTTSGREAHPHPETIGAFIQNVPILVPKRARAFSEVHAAVTEASAHGEFDPAALAEALGYPMDAPLFESSVVIQNYPTERMENDGALRVQIVSASDDTVFPITVVVYPEPDFRIRLHARSGAAEPHQAQGLLDAFTALLERIAHEPQCELATLEAPRDLSPPPREKPKPKPPVRRDAHGTTDALVRSVLRESFGNVPDLMDRNFFDLGGSSLTLLRLRQRLGDHVGRELPVTLFFRTGNGRRLAEALDGAPVTESRHEPTVRERHAGARFAIVGMAGRFPGAAGIDALWTALREGREGIRRLSPDELGPEGRDAHARDPQGFVGACSELEDIEQFDAALFDISPREAELLDPQQRVLLETAYQALENAGYDPRSVEDGGGGVRRRVGVFASSTLSSYLVYNLLSRRELLDEEGAWRLAMANEKDCGPSRIAYKLGLTGPAIAVQTACSSSLVAVHVACASLASGECDMALAGGVSIRVPHKAGYSKRDAEILSHDGRCAAFGADASGTVLGDGAGLVVLKRLEDAIRDRDPIWAVVLGSMINNDGARKAGYTAPSVEGQREVLLRAFERAGVRADSIQLVEAHGTGTPLGDPIEFEALTEAFRAHTEERAFCALGSIKSNLGHLDNAAGIAGLIKCVLALHHREIPPTLHAEPVNPVLDVASSPFYVAQAPRPWPETRGPRRAAVSSFGIGGTNAHAILESWENVPREERFEAAPELLLLSARTEEGLAKLAGDWGRYIENLEGPLSDPLRTSQLFREHFPLRRAVVAASASELREALAQPRAVRTASAPPVVAVFPGQGSQYRGMLRGLRASNAAFREAEDACIALLGGPDTELGQMLLDGEADPTPTRFAQVAMFVGSYAMLRAIEAAGLHPVAYVGHSIGELVAAVAAGAVDLATALAMVRVRGEAMASMPEGAMLAVSLGRADVAAMLPARLDIAAVNGASATVVAGPVADVDAFQELLAAKHVSARRLHTAHAFHSRSALEAADTFLERMTAIPAAAETSAPVFSSVTGNAIDAAALTRPQHWRDQIDHTVAFHDAIQAATLRFEDAIFVEVGPGQALTALLRGERHTAIPLGKHPAHHDGDDARWLAAIGELWELGVPLDFGSISPRASFRRRRIPGAILEPRRFWIEPASAPAPSARAYVPTFRPAPPQGAVEDPSALAVVFDEPELDLPRLHDFVQRLGRASREKPDTVVHGVLVSRQGVSVRGEAVHSAEWAFGYGTGLVAQMEFPNVRFRAVDVTADATPDDVAATLRAELASTSSYPLVAWRGTERFELDFTPHPTGGHAPLLRRGDVVLITGGLGAIGRRLAAHLAEHHGAHVVVGTRRQDVENLVLPSGAAVPCIPLDVTDPESIAAALAFCEARFGAVSGIFHAAGIDKSLAYRALDELTPADFARHFDTKVDGTRNLAGAIAGRGVRFVALFSSLSAYVGGLGCGAHAAANRFLDVFAASAAGETRWLSVAWDRWLFEDDTIPHTAESRRLALNPAAAFALLDGLLAEGAPASVLVSTEPPMRRIEGRVGGEARATRHARPLLRTSFVAAASETEVALAKILADILGLSEVGVLDDLFDLGASSLHSARISEKVRAAFDVHLPLKDVFAARTARALATRIDTARTELSPTDWRAMVRGPGALAPHAPRPASHGQTRMWFLQQMDPETSHYTNAISLWIDGHLDHGRFCTVIDALVARHAMLRTVFRQDDDAIVQIALPELRIDVPLRDLSGLPMDQRRARSDALARAQSRRTFDLERGPLVHFELHRFEANRHRLTFIYHHIVADTWSLELFMREFVQAYVSGPGAMPPPSFSYADFAEWQRRPEVEAEYQSQLAYWTERLREHAIEDSPIDLPADRPRPAEQSFRGATIVFDVPSETAAGLRKLASSLGVSSFAIALHAFRILLARYGSGDGVTAIGVPVSGRAHSSASDIFGFFVNTIVLLGAVDEDASVQSNLLREAENALAALERQDVPFERVVEAVNPARSLSQSPLFQVMFSYENVPEETRATKALSFRAEKIDGGTSIFDLVLSVHEAAGALGGDLSYATDLFDAPTAERIVEHYVTVLSELVRDAERPVRHVGHVNASERRELLEALNAKRYAAPEGPFVDRVFDCAKASPRAIAFVHGASRTDYATLAERISEVARGLSAIGLAPEDRVALMLPRGLDLVVCLLAIHHAGGAFVAIDPSLPALRRERLLELSGARFGIAQAKETLGQVEVFTHDELRARGAGLADSPRPAHAHHGLAYLLFTSGSTGEPKGAMVEHGGMVNHLFAKIEDLGIGPGDVVAQTAGLSFDIFVWQLVAALGVGGTTVVYDDDVVREPDVQLRALVDDRVTVFQIVPSYLGAMLDAFDAFPIPPALGWRVVSVTGEAVQPALCARFLQLFPEVRLLNAYGPTECSDDITHHFITQDDARGLRVPIGRPIHNANLYVVDARMRLSGLGVPGEILAGGIPVGRGYIGDPQRTALTFVADPFAVEPGSRAYRTGDVGRVRPDGVIEFLGRRDHQIKVRGHRIELGEIDSVLASFPGVREAATVLAKSDDAPPKLVAFVAMSGQTEQTGGDASELRAHLAERVSAAMVPSHIALLDALPLTANRKVDRKALERRALELARTTTAGDAIDGPRTAREVAVCDVFAEVLGLDAVGRADNFFELGGDSISSLQVVSKLRQRGFRITAKNVFQHQTVAELAAHVDETNTRASALLHTGEVPLSPLQKRFFAMPGEGLDRWNLGVRLRLTRAVTLSELTAAGEVLLRTHPMLRARFERTADGVKQILQEDGRVAVLSVPADGVERLCGEERLCSEISLTGAKLALGLVDDQPGEVLLVAHHLVTDAVSLQILVEDLLVLLDGAHEAKTDAMAEVSGFGDWLDALRNLANAPDFSEEKAFWGASIERAFPAGAIPVDHEGVDDREGDLAHLSYTFDAATTQKLLARLRDDFRIQPLEALASALAASLSEWMPREGITLWLEGHGRDELDERVDLSRSVGWFTAIYPVTFDASEDRAQRIRAAKDAIRAVARGGSGFVGFEATEERELLPYGVTLNYLGDLDRAAGNHPLLRSVEPLIGGLRAPECGRMELLDVAGYLSNGQLHVVIGHGAQHDAWTIRKILDGLCEELALFAQDGALEGADVVVTSDFSAATLTDDDLAALRAHLELVT
ncbi:amino acid adenylation domain-containing protein [Pendulispora rubella]|uniref:Amino acid adenylation domain-containing protein n=1 Tax=Pendulispora rubella TaxID=2741070 RepID=A0ABZ2LKT7_9BACT